MTRDADLAPHSRLDVPEILCRLGGSARLHELTRHTTRYRVQQARTSGEVRRRGRGLYVLPDLPAPTVAAARARGVLSHTRAAGRLGIPMLLPSRGLHITVPHGAKPPPMSRVTYHWRTLATDQVEGAVTSAVRTVLDCAAALPFGEALAIADAARHLALVAQEDLLRAAITFTGSGSARARRVVAASCELAENPFESARRAVLIEAGISGLRCQVPIHTPEITARVDLADTVRGLIVEADSFTYHGADRAAFERDCLRYDEFVRTGWTVLRFTWEHVMFEPAWVAGVVKDVTSRLDLHPRPRARRDRPAAHRADLG